MNLPAPMRSLVERLTPRQRQYAMLATILLGGVGLLWLVFAFAESSPSGQAGKASGSTPGPVTNIGVMPPGQQVNPVDSGSARPAASSRSTRASAKSRAG